MIKWNPVTKKPDAYKGIIMKLKQCPIITGTHRFVAGERIYKEWVGYSGGPISVLDEDEIEGWFYLDDLIGE